MSRRMSFGGIRSSSTPLSDGSSNHNRRIGSARSETPQKDRQVQLHEWRQSRSTANEPHSKRSRHDAPPLLPPTATTILPAGSQPSPLDGLSAVERVRMRRMMQMQFQQQYQQQPLQQHQQFSQEDDPTMMMQMQMRPEYGDEATMSLGLSSRSLLLPPSYPSQQDSMLSQLTVDSNAQDAAQNNNAIIDSVEGAALRSSNRQLQLRVEQLEKEKMELCMSKAPLEARYRQEQQAWDREQARLLQEIEQLKHARCQAEDANRDLILKQDATQAEVRQLRQDLRKASSSLNNTSNASSSAALMGGAVWTQRLQQKDKELAELKEEVQALQLDKVSIEKELHANKILLERTMRQYEELEQEYDSVAQSSNTNRDAEIQLEVLTTEHIATSAQLNAVCADLAATKARSEATMEAREQVHKAEIEQLHFEISVLKTRAGKMDTSYEASMEQQEEDDVILRARIDERDRRIAELEQEIRKGEELRRQMHNRIQELRGNIRVFVRCRPFLPSDQQTTNPAIDVMPDGESLAIVDPRNETPHDFKFDKIFSPSSGQDHVFQEVADFVQSALDGYQVCLFSYGQTGSGKTHTMQGSGNGAMRGIIPRAVEQILTQANKMNCQKWDFFLTASFLEIYNENLKDLLVTMDDTKNGGEPPKLAIKRNRAGKSFVENLTEVPIECVDSAQGMHQLETLMNVAARARSVASTKMNAQSSRSHSVFMLHIRGSNRESGTEVQGSLNLCDLAGSERLDRSGASNDAKRLKETQAINKSLSCLGDVFNALAQRASHVPYRNSKLTYLLQDCLSGDGKALMFVNLSPTTESSGESLCSLRFAQRVNQVELGKPTKNIQYNAH